MTYIGVKKACQPKNESSKASDPQFQIRRFLNGTDSLNIAQYMNKNVISVLEESENITLLLNNYFRLHQGYTQKFYLNKHDLFQKRVTEWKELFNKLFHSKYVTNHIQVKLKICHKKKRRTLRRVSIKAPYLRCVSIKAPYLRCVSIKAPYLRCVSKKTPYLRCVSKKTTYLRRLSYKAPY